jgi:hypothetical protein
MGYQERTSNGYKNVVEVAGYYGVGFINEIDWWFCFEHQRPERGAILLSENNTLVQDRIELVSQFVGTENANKLYHISDIKSILEVEQLCNEVTEILQEANQSEDCKEQLGNLEDLGFYCSEIIRTVDSIRELYKFLEQEWDEDLSTEFENALQDAFGKL